MSDEVVPNVQAMRAVLDRVFAGKLRQCVNGVWVTLTRSAHCWRMALASGDGKITRTMFDRVATAASAPSLDPWQRNENGTVISAEWREGAPPVRMV